MHVFTNLLIEFDADGTTARSRAKVVNPAGMRGEDGEIHNFQIVGSYEDVWTKTDDGWRISERVWVHGWISGDYPQAGLPASEF